MARVPRRRFFRLFKRAWRSGGNMVRRTFARTGGPRARSNRLYRRFARRRPQIPELKWIDRAIETKQIGIRAGIFTNWNDGISANSISQGPAKFERIGTKLKLTKLQVRIYMYDTSDAGISAPNLANYLVRFVFWTPRVPYTQAVDAFSDVSNESILDYNRITVHKDVSYTMGSAFMLNPPNIVVSGSSNKSIAIRNFTFKFPRSVQLTNDNNALDPNKDVMYLFLLCNSAPGSAVNFVVNTRTYFIDA